jgi:hypothetical protein
MVEYFTEKTNIGINTSSLEKGVYLLTVLNNNTIVKTIKIIKE